MDKRSRKNTKSSINNNGDFEEVSSRQWEIVNLSPAEEDLVYRMHKLVGNRSVLSFNVDHCRRLNR
ncbi:CAPRICE-like MYB3 [Artemisia annua]|uniref:CAPRICE-like MYB3 n=1 Tax=Artemisia annua TaxID=35608 RepID=A0A2U1NTT3_ARTAN|nr:CAPRICE-like MYB3 [Artemisia annua]